MHAICYYFVLVFNQDASFYLWNSIRYTKTLGMKQGPAMPWHDVSNIRVAVWWEVSFPIIWFRFRPHWMLPPTIVSGRPKRCVWVWLLETEISHRVWVCLTVHVCECVFDCVCMCARVRGCVCVLACFCVCPCLCICLYQLLTGVGTLVALYSKDW